MTNTQRLALDLALLAAVLAAMAPSVTGIWLHVAIGGLLVLPALLHLALNWDWVLHTADHALERGRGMPTFNLAIDLGLFGSLVAVTVSGVMLLPAVVAITTTSVAWAAVHHVSALSLAALSLAHAALHLGWMSRAARRALLGANTSTTTTIEGGA